MNLKKTDIVGCIRSSICWIISTITLGVKSMNKNQIKIFCKYHRMLAGFMKQKKDKILSLRVGNNGTYVCHGLVIESLFVCSNI